MPPWNIGGVAASTCRQQQEWSWQPTPATAYQLSRLLSLDRCSSGRSGLQLAGCKVQRKRSAAGDTVPAVTVVPLMVTHAKQ